MDIAIIGAGASGLAAAITAASKGASVCVFEKKDTIGKKLLATGNGKCNLLNEDQDRIHFHSNNLRMAKEVLSYVSVEDIKRFFAEIGVLTTSRNGYLYPMSEQAKSVRNALVDAAKERDVQFEMNTEISSVEDIGEGVRLKSTDGRKFKAKYVIIATGTKAGLKRKDDPGVNLVISIGHSIHPLIPALCAFAIDSDMCERWKGVRTKAKISLYVGQKLRKTEYGELMLTDYGISGIPAFQLSGYVYPNLNKKISLGIDWLPGLSKAEIRNLIEYMSKTYPNKRIPQYFYGVLNDKLANTVIIRICEIVFDRQYVGPLLLRWPILSKSMQEDFINLLKDFRLPVWGLNDYKDSQVCAGGVPLTEIDTDTCRSKLNKRFFITGELLDVNGDCGGYNLQWAWTTGILAGRAAGESISPSEQ